MKFIKKIFNKLKKKKIRDKIKNNDFIIYEVDSNNKNNEQNKQINTIFKPD